MAVRTRGCLNYDVVEIDREELRALPKSVELPKEKSTVYNFTTSEQAIRFINKHKNDDWRIEMYVHDSTSNLNVGLFRNVGHAPGVSIGELAVHAKPGFSRWMRSQSPIGELGQLDFFQVKVYRDWRKQ